MTSTKVAPDIDWESVRRRALLKMVSSEPGVIWAQGHCIKTLGAHTGHTVRTIAYCESEDWANAIVHAVGIAAANAETIS